MVELRPLTLASLAPIIGYTPRHVARLYERWAARQHDPTMPRTTTVHVVGGNGARQTARAVLWPVAA